MVIGLENDRKRIDKVSSYQNPFYDNLLITNCAALDPRLQAAVHRFSAKLGLKVGGHWWLLK